MQNIKLLDLQTGKYLELGQDWLYGGEYIRMLKYDNRYIPDDHIISEPQEPLKTLCEKTGAVIFFGAKWCSDNLGKVYGGRYVLLQFANNKTVGDVIKHNPKRTQFDQLPKMYHTNKEVCEILSKDVVLCEEMGYSSEYVDPDYHSKIIGNIFEEYSKQLRNEPNKFEELMELIK